MEATSISLHHFPISVFKILVLVCACFFVVIIVLFLILLIRNIRYRRTLTNRDKAKNNYNNLIYDYLYNTISLDDLKSKIPRSEDNNIQIIIFDTLTLIKGAMADKLIQLCSLLGLTDKILERLNSAKWWIKLEACHHLIMLKEVKAKTTLIKCLNDTSGAVRLAAVQALATFLHPGELIRLIDPDTTSSTFNLHQVAAILTRSKTNFFKDIEPFLKKVCSKRATLFYIELLKTIKDPQSIKYMLPLLVAEDNDLKLSAIDFFAHMPHSDAVSQLTILLTHSLPSIRMAAARTLGCMNDPNAIEHLSKALSDPDWNVRYTTAVSLAAMGEKALHILNEKKNSDETLSKDISLRILKEKELEVIASPHLDTGGDFAI